MFHIGKNLVALMIEKAGLDVIELGADPPESRLAGAVRDTSHNSSGRPRS
jgi:methanogenic corrinoid protein MtbC1